jgi:hypothetical protein
VTTLTVLTIKQFHKRNNEKSSEKKYGKDNIEREEEKSVTAQMTT